MVEYLLMREKSRGIRDFVGVGGTTQFHVFVIHFNGVVTTRDEKVTQGTIQTDDKVGLITVMI